MEANTASETKAILLTLKEHFIMAILKSRRNRAMSTAASSYEFDECRSVVQHQASQSTRRPKMNKRTQAGGNTNPKRRKGGGGSLAPGSQSLQEGNNSTSSSTANASPIPDQHPPVNWNHGKQIVIKWAFVFLSAWFYLEMKKYWAKSKEENPFPDL